MNLLRLHTLPLFALALGLGLGACSDDNDANNDGKAKADMATQADMANQADMAKQADMGKKTDMTVATGTAYTIRVENVSTPKPIHASGSFDTDTTDEKGPLAPGKAYEFRIEVPPPGKPGVPFEKGGRLSFATMFIPSNDLFFAPDPQGIALYDDQGKPVSGDVTNQIFLWDAGTEKDEPLGQGENQPQRGKSKSAGADANETVRKVTAAEVANLPAVADLIKVTLIPGDQPYIFTLRIENVSAGKLLTTPPQGVPISPGIWAVHSPDAALFTPGEKAPDNGLKALAEEGSPEGLLPWVTERTGLIIPLSPVGYAVHRSTVSLFTPGQPVPANGLEAIAEDGDPAALGTALALVEGISTVGTMGKAVDATMAGPIGPGGAYEFEVNVERGERLSLATMFVQSNDWFYAFGPQGLDFPASGDVTDQLLLWDSGTEVNQPQGAGPDQAPRQAMENLGAAENGKVTQVNPTIAGIPATAEVIKVTVTPK